MLSVFGAIKLVHSRTHNSVKNKWEEKVVVKPAKNSDLMINVST